MSGSTTGSAQFFSLGEDDDPVALSPVKTPTPDTGQLIDSPTVTVGLTVGRWTDC